MKYLSNTYQNTLGAVVAFGIGMTTSSVMAQSVELGLVEIRDSQLR